MTTDAQADFAFTIGDECWSVWTASERCTVRVATSEGVTAEYPLDAPAPSSFTASSVQGSDGAVWIALNYGVTRFADGEATTWTLDVDVEDQLPGATDRGAPLAGTWATALAPADNGGVWLARLNVPYLTRISPQGERLRGPALSPEFSGSRHLRRRGEATYLAQGWLAEQKVGIGVLHPDGSVETLPISGVVQFEGDKGLTNYSIVDLDTLEESVHEVGDAVEGLWRVGPKGEEAWWDRVTGSVVHTQLGRLQLEAYEATGSGPVADGVTRIATTDTVLEQVMDLRIDDSGVVWILRAGGNQLDFWG